MTLTSLHVVVGIVYNEQHEVLIALRPPHVVQPGVWEFPGGKVEPNETIEDALIREFQEEIGISITHAEFILTVEKPVPHKNVLLILHAFHIRAFHGVPHGCENQDIRWVPIHTLPDYTFPETNADIIASLMAACTGKTLSTH